MNEPMPKAGLSECSTLLGAYAMRCLFCLVPAVGLGLAVAVAHSTLGAFIFCCMFGLGWQITEPHPERGESMTPNAQAVRKTGQEQNHE